MEAAGRCGTARVRLRAAVYSRYGPPDVVRVEEVEKPVPKDDEILVRVRASSVNPYDLHFMRGEPYPLRLSTGLGAPKFTRLGVDFAGEVEAIGSKATRFKAGDAVFGASRGAFAEYVCGAETKFAAKPANISFEQAGATHVAAYTALQALRNVAKVRAGEKVLVNGAAGGVGTFAVQIAKAFGARVTGVCSTRNVEMVRSIGADAAIDYTRENFTNGKERCDVILDCVGNHSLLRLRKVLATNGRCVAVGGKTGPWMLGLMGQILAAPVISLFGGKRVSFLFAKPSTPEDVKYLSGLMATGKVEPVIDRRYNLDEIADALRYVEAGHARGKVAITID